MRSPTLVLVALLLSCTRAFAPRDGWVPHALGLRS